MKNLIILLSILVTAQSFSLETLLRDANKTLDEVVNTAENGTATIITKLDDGIRNVTMWDADANAHFIDLWVKVSDLIEMSKYKPEKSNKYYLYTRQSNTSELLQYNETASVTSSHFNSSNRVVVIIHGWRNNINSTIFKIMVPAFLKVEDVNVIAVDWSAGADIINYVAAVGNTVASGESVAKFLNWLNNVTGATPAQYHIAGHSLGGQQSGIVGRHMDGNVSYITAMDPAMPGWFPNEHTFRASDGNYTEVIHTNAGFAGYILPLGRIDFFPNGGTNQPGCGVDLGCDHSRSYEYYTESITSGGFTAEKCGIYAKALIGNCHTNVTANMGGIRPMPGITGQYYLKTNSEYPYSKN